MNQQAIEPLQAAALGLALRSGMIQSIAEVSAHLSHASSSSYALMAADGRLLVRFPLARVKQWAKRRERVLARLERRQRLARLPVDNRRADFRSQPDRTRALAWSISTGQPIPPGRFGPTQALVALLLLLLGLVPGVIYLAWAWPRQAAYQQALRQVERRWLAAGMPDPQDSAFQRLVSP
ncbi:hypothetical protein BBFGKLBO_01207 [Synechococcus sp. CBW1107]|nr:hypothetical protein BBFGKLBO_01207 [Synechococcus sp. CBW1107]